MIPSNQRTFVNINSGTPLKIKSEHDHKIKIVIPHMPRKKNPKNKIISTFYDFRLHRKHLFGTRKYSQKYMTKI